MKDLMTNNVKRFALLLSSLSLISTAHAQITLISEAGDWIGGGNDTILTEPFTLDISESEISIRHNSGYRFNFTAPDDKALNRGVYLEAERSAFKGPLNPGMTVNSTGRGCNEIAGEFHIFEYDATVEPPVLAMDFIQYCGSAEAALRGNIRINSDVAVPYPVPLAHITTSNKVPGEGETIQLSTNSSVVNNSPYTVTWTQVAGADAVIVSPYAEETSVLLPEDLALGGESLVFEATVVDSAGNIDVARLNLHVSSKSDPQTFLSLESEEGDYVDFYSLGNAIFRLSGNYANGVSIDIEGSESWNFDAAAEDELPLQVGIYDPTERFPFQSDGVAGLSVFGGGHACNESFGAFEVIQLESENDEPVAFRATFERACESASAPRLRGEVAVNAVDPNVPTALAGDDAEVSEGETVYLDGSGSFDVIGVLSSYAWSSEDATIVITDRFEPMASFVAPSLGDGVESDVISVQLDIVDNEGFKARDTVDIKVIQNNRPPVALDDEVDVELGKAVEIDVTSNDTEEDGRLLLDTISIIQQPVAGTVSMGINGIIEYRPSGDEPVTDSFTYTINDNDGAVSNLARVTINVFDSPPVSGLDCRYVVANDWGSGFVASIAVTNTSETAVEGWNVEWSYAGNNRVVFLWNASLSGNNPYGASSMPWNGTLQPGQSTSFGFVGTKSGSVEVPELGGDCN